MKMKLEDFYKITDADEYFEFFDIDYDQRLIDSKRFHLMRKFGELIEKTKTLSEEDEERLLGFYRFALLRVYKDFETGYNPSAADVWGMFDKPSPCFTCATQVGCSSDEFGREEADVSSCATR
jgi:nitrogenase-stabilizing/protective protein